MCQYRAGLRRCSGSSLYVFFQDTAVTAGAGHVGQVHAGFGSQLGSGRHGSATRCSSRSSLYRSRSGSSYGSRGIAGLGGGVDTGDQLTGNHGRAVLFDDFNNHASLRCRQFQHNLVGFQVDDVFVAIDEIASFLVPGHQRGFGNGLGQLGDFDFNNHVLLQSGAVILPPPSV